MIRTITPLEQLGAVVRVPGSKSITNRALVCAALARGPSRILLASDSDDTHRMANGLNQLGVLVRRSGTDLLVEGTGGRLFAPRYPIAVGNAGTAFRFLSAVAAFAGGTTTFAIDSRMAERPMEELFGPLRLLGATIESGETALGVAITGGGLNGGEVAVRAGKSSQFLSALLLVAPCTRGPLVLRLEGDASSRAYIDMTIEVMKGFGVEVERREEAAFSVPAGHAYRPSEFCVEADASGASYFFAAAAIAGGTVEVQGVSLRSAQPDMGFPGILERMGCAVEEVEDGVRVTGPGVLEGIDVDMNGMPDVVPTLVVTALFAVSPSRIRNIGHLRYKESDRLAALADELSRTGARVEIVDDGLLIVPGRMQGVQLETRGDHRLAMSFALLGLRVPGIVVENPSCVAKSFPTFWEEFDALGGAPGRTR